MLARLQATDLSLQARSGLRPDAACRLQSAACRLFHWQAKRESNPQPPVLETGALPIELLAFKTQAPGPRLPALSRPRRCVTCPGGRSQSGADLYFDSRCPTCFRQNRQYLLNSSRSVVFFLFFVVL